MITGHSNIRENPSSSFHVAKEERLYWSQHPVNRTKTEYPKEKTVHQLFEEQTLKTPDHIALVSGERQLTYQEVDQQSNQIAAFLRQKGMGRNKIVGIMVEKSPEMIIGLLAVFKSGASYLPIDPEAPQDRIEYMLRDSGASMLLTSLTCKDKSQYDSMESIFLEEEDFGCFPSHSLTHVNDAADLAYIIYTSGSTGYPKGVAISHYSAIRVVRNTNYITITDDDSVLQMSNFAFDGSVFEIFGALLNGARLVMIDKEQALDITQLAALTKQQQITVMFITTAFFNAIVEREISCFEDVRKVLFGGERVSVTHAKKALAYMGPNKLIHVYGPTESTVFATYYPINKIHEEATTIPIGKPIANTTVFIIDEHNNPVPIGTPGELCISGDGLAAGYLNNESLTSKKFIPHPFIPEERMYRTGDLARWLPDYNIEFLERIDQQVKLRGFRIELGEIENHLLKHEAVTETFVTVRENQAGHKHICAYMTAERDITVEELRTFLGRTLPDYMIPAYYVKLDRLPLTTNGKVDKKALPEPDGSIVTGSEYVAPKNDTEQKLAAIWQDVLQISRIGINDSFVHLGGHSLNAIELIARINEQLNVNLPLNQLFRLSTIKKIGAYLEENQENVADEGYFSDIGDPGSMHEPFALTGIQLAYLIGRDATFEMGGAATNFTVEFEANADITKVNAALQKLIARHPILRTVVFENGTQKIIEKPPLYTVEVLNATNWIEPQIESDMQAERQRMLTKIINPSQWPLFEIKAYLLPSRQYYFYLNIDPLICDDSSLKILIKEFKWLYDHSESQLLQLKYTFRDYVLAMAEFKQSGRYLKDKHYWMDKLETFPSSPALPLKCSPAHVDVPRFKKFSNFMNGIDWNKLKQRARERNVTPTSVLCAAYAYVLAYWSNQERFGINLTVFNRIPFHEDVKKMAGDFTTLMLLDINAAESSHSFWNFTDRVQDSLLEALEHRHYDGVDFIRQLGRKHNMKKRAVMPIVFTSVLNENPEDSFDKLFNFEQIKFFSTRTSQVFIDNQVYEINGGLYITWDFVEQLFDEDVITSMFEQYLQILNEIITADRVSEIEISAVSRQIIEQYNNTRLDLPVCPLHEMLSNTAKSMAENIAVRHHENTMTYRELDEKSNQIARYFMEKGVSKGDYIGVIAKRGINTIVNLFGVLKAGAAYIPLDPDYPDERKQYIREKCQCKFFIEPSLYEQELLHTYSAEAVDSGVTLEDMAYVIFTSGSTGNPKGVQITHGAAANTILDINSKFNVTANDRIMGISSLCFDLSVYDVFGALSSGAVLVIIDDQRDMFRLKEVIEKEKITIWNSVPAIMGMVVDLYSLSEQNNDLRAVLLSGDWIPLQLPAKIKKIFRNTEVVSLGGATEASIWSIYYPITQIAEEWKSIPYGIPLANQQIYVLNQNRQPCPVNVEGELYIGGTGVANGYIHDEEKTRQSFILHPQLGHIYKTGDYGVLKPEGVVEFLGRKDSQVKIRGYRVELGEIENCLLQSKDVRKTAVIDSADEQGTKHLYAFIISDKNAYSLSLKRFLQNKLPGYMIPTMFFNVDEIPLTVNGKVNKGLLEEVVRQHHLTMKESAPVYAEPADPTQKKLLSIWKEIFGLEHISTDASCFDLGGDSLKIMAIAAEVKKQLHIEIPIGEMFRHDTIHSLNQYLKSRSDAKQDITIETIPEQEYYATSAAQKSMYMLSLFENNRGAYHIPMGLFVEGKLQIGRLEQALQTFIERHEILRTGFEVIQDELVQKVHAAVEFRLEYDDLGDIDTDTDQLIALTSKLCKESTQSFDLSKPPLMRAKVARIGHNQHLFIINFHHIVADGASQGILMNELLELYSHDNLPDIDLHYKDYTAWQENYSQSDVIRKQEAYWLEVFSSEPPKLELPYDFKRREVSSYEGNNIHIPLGSELSNQVRQLAKETGSTLYMVMLSAYYILLYKYSHQTDIVVGTAASGRLHQPLQNMFGVFVNTIAMRNQLNETESIKQLIEQIKHTTVAAFEHSEYPFDELVRKTGFDRNANRNPLFDTMFVLENADLFTRMKDGLKMSPVMFNLDNAKFDLTFNVLEFENEMVLNIEYSTELFHFDTIRRMGDNYVTLLTNISSNLDLKVKDVDCLAPAEKTLLMDTFNQAAMDYPQEQTVNQWFEEQVKRTPDHLALVMEEQQMTYREVDERSNQLARVLRSSGVQPDRIVGVLLERSVDAVIGMLAVLKAGGAFLPIDPAYPADRINYMLQDSQAGWLLTRKELSKQVNLLQNDEISLIDMDDARIGAMDCHRIDSRHVSGNLAYLIYTSGSTGKPKGVMITHQSLVHLCTWHNTCYQITAEDRSASYASMSFDAFVWEVFPYLLSGSSVHLISEEIRLDVIRINEYFHKHQISIAFLPTQICEQFMRLDNRSLRTLLTGGDKLNYFETKNYQIVNNYGPTENTVVTTSFTIDQAYTNIPIGQPLPNTKVFILDAHDLFCPIGVPGELCISGPGLASGYWNRPELTAEKFASHPAVPEERMYRTGDLARWMPDGNIEYLGRMDDQVKIRGFRIELGEIDNLLLQHEGVKEAVVLAKEEGKYSSYLCAYIVMDKTESKHDTEDIKQYLSGTLPEYMVPSYFVTLDNLPLTPNGKVDRRALPDPETVNRPLITYEAPSNETEVKLAAIWRDILGKADISVHDNFFHIGGHSLMATLLISRLHKELQAVVPLGQLFRTPTVRGLAEHITDSKQSEYMTIPQAAPRPYYELSPAQRRIYILNQLDHAGTTYNMPFAMKIKGELNVQQLSHAFSLLVARHESLRTSFVMLDGKPVQRIEKDTTFTIQYNRFKSGDNPNMLTDWVKPFQLDQAPLMRIEVVRVDEHEHIMLFDMHHIISDGVSVAILLEELAELYRGNQLAPVSVQYKDYVHWYAERYRFEGWKRQEQHWMDVFEGGIPVLEMPTDYARPKNRSYHGDQLHVQLDIELTNKLDQMAKEHGATMYMLFLTAFTALLSRYTDQEDIVIGTPVAGRDHEDLRRVVGMFVNTLALRNKPFGHQTFREYLQQVKENTLKAYENQDYPFERLVDLTDVKRDASRNPLFDVMLVQNTEQISLDIDGLQFTLLEDGANRSKFDLTIRMNETSEGWKLELEYCLDLFRKERMQQFAAHFIQVLKQAVEMPDIQLNQLDILTEQEKRMLVYGVNPTKQTYSKEKTLTSLFKEQVDRTPDATALVYEHISITYRELNERANSLAIHLRAKGAGPETVIAVMMERSIEMIVAVFGVLKAGGAYLPIDPDYPDERKKYMLSDSGALLLCVADDKGWNSDIFNGEMIRLNALDSVQGAEPEPLNRSSDAAYVIYTSGSTGQPKGVVIEQFSVHNLVGGLDTAIYSHYPAPLNFALIAPFVFDASVKQIFASLLLGHTLHLVPKETSWDADRLLDYYVRHGIHVSDGTPAHLKLLTFADSSRKAKLDIKEFIIGGDVLTHDLLNEVYGTLPGLTANVTNVYGPTECTVDAVYNRVIYGEQKRTGGIPIGQPLQNTAIYIMDRSQRLQPIGVTGELCIAGEGVARGYLNKPELTAKKFIEHPFEPGKKMYRTGDLAKWLPDGQIEFVGRVDHQVKIRGYRIELGEIEHQLIRLEQIEEAVVTAGKDNHNNDYLCAYIVTRQECTLMDVRECLEKHMPAYMIPAYFVKLNRLPRTVSGKVDRSQLPEPEKTFLNDSEYEAPRNDKEQLMIQIWQEVLDFRQIGINHNFFAVGGDSIKALQIVSKIAKQGLRLEMRDLFAHPTIRQLSKYVKEICIRHDYDERVTGEAVLTPIQQRFFERNCVEHNHFNQSFMLYRNGGFNERAVVQSFNKLMEHHDGLRMSYSKNADGHITQTIMDYEDQMFELDIHHLKGIEHQELFINKQASEIQKKMSIEKGRLVKLGLFRLDEGDHLLIAIHHLVIDGVSWRILLEDFELLYQQALNGERLNIDYKTDSFKHYASQLKAYSDSYLLGREKPYWQFVSRVKTSFLNNQRAKSDKPNVFTNSRTAVVGLGKKETQWLLRETNRAYHTEINDILLTALLLSAREIADENRFKIMLEGHGRENIGTGVDVSRTIGWFTSVYPVVFELSGEQYLPLLIKTVKETIRNIPNKGIGYGILKYLSDIQDFADETEAPILFNYLGELDSGLNRKEFQASSMPTGQTVGGQLARAHLFEINAVVMDGTFVVHTSYNALEYDEHIVDQFNRLFMQYLELIIRHCKDKKSSEKTPSDYGNHPVSLVELKSMEEKYYPFTIEEIYTLTNLQAGILYHSLENKSSNAYFQQVLMDLHGEIDVDTLEQSFHEIIQRHEGLRAAFEYKLVEHPRQVILDNRKAVFVYLDWAGESAGNQEQLLEAYKASDKAKGFDLSRDMLIRICLMKTAERSYTLLLSHHHILMDGWCLNILIHEMFHIYANHITREPYQLEEPRPLGDYLQWLDQQNKEEAIAYWKDHLQGYREQATFPKTSLNRRDGQHSVKEKEVRFSPGLTSQLKHLAAKNHVTFNALFQTIWGLALCRYNEAEDVVYGTVISGRETDVDGIENMIGLFINTIPTRVRLNSERLFTDAMRQVQEEGMQGQKYGYVNLAEIQEQSGLKRNLLDHVLVFQNFSEVQASGNQDRNRTGFTLQRVYGNEHTHYNLSVAAVLQERFVLKMAYNESVFDAGLIDQLELHLLHIAKQITVNEEIRVKDIVLVSEDERQKLGYLFHGKQTDYPREKTIPELFEEQVEKTPDAAAVVMGHIRLSYRELHEKSNRLAARLRARGIQSQAIIGLMAERSPDMIVGILGILKSGAAYLPMDPEWPSERIEHMLHDSGAALLLTQQQWMTGLPSGTEAMLLDSDEEDMAAAELGREPETGSADDLAYIIYTSGSTGTPKGVMISHANAIRVVQETDYITIRQEDAVLQLSNYAFDGSVFDIFGALLNGARLVLIEQETVLDIAKLAEVMNRENITVAFMTTALFNVLVDREPDCLKGLRKLLFGGERGSVIHARKALASLGPDKLIHVYGPTESTVFTTYYPINEIDEDAGSLPIGKPIANTSVWIVDRNQQLVPPGVPGELCISGDGLSRGYLNNEELTATQFVPHPFESGGRMYRTGDRVRWLPDGQIEFLERMDHQVKLRGYRIELGEIEQVLLEHENIREAIVLARKDPAGQDVLYAYVTAAVELSRTEIRAYAGSRLPGYMIPAYFILLDHLPLTANGKVDRKALPEPDSSAHAESGYAAPSNYVEEQLVSVWEEVLNMKPVGTSHNFFEIGGNSLKVMHAVQLINKKFHTELSISQFFEHPTVKQLAFYILSGDSIHSDSNEYIEEEI
ncbi:non-ribosomal peptide synthetase [Paenibacillus durus]|uniref:Phenyloxazoline synthase MbtB n=1 Tax=Paenibacillus durus TaxID=44251 RepID=A0A089HKH6_PAEDU|nr:non-ribosomal peptide synthetase [Paenibacillus durus]AIQ12431.1 glutamate racemase [Paenibacillus durus]